MSKSTRIFAIKTTGAQERSSANYIENRVRLMKRPIYSVLVVDAMKGYIFVEGDNAQVVSDSASGFKHLKTQVPGILHFPDIEKFLVTKSIIEDLKPDDVVEVVAGPFKGMKAKITSLEKAKGEVTILLLDAPYPLPVTVDAGYLKLVQSAKVAPEMIPAKGTFTNL